MLNIKLLRDDPRFVQERLLVKNFDASVIIDTILEYDLKRRNIQTELDSILSGQNTMAKEIGQLMKSGDREKAEALKSKVASLKERSKELEGEMDKFSQDRKSVV